MLSRFLSDLFDLSAHVDDEAIRVKGANLSFLIIERKKLAASGSSNIIDFYVDSYEELEMMHQKVEFIYYRYEISEIDEDLQKPIMPEIKKSNEMSFFFITDPDRRRWKVSYIH